MEIREPERVSLDARLRLTLALYAFSVLGFFLLVAPWTPVWEQAVVTLLPTRLGAWITSGWVRGLTSGLGVLDLIVAAQVGTELRHRAG
jgi:hypothetical protein